MKDTKDEVVIACEVVKYELENAMAKTGRRLPVIWVDSDYHDNPNQLREILQQQIDSIKDKDVILLAYGSCGNALVGIEATTADLVIPKIDDCTSMFLSRQGEEFTPRKKTYFLTKGWLESPRGLAADYKRAVEKYGKDTAKRIFDLMLQGYEHLMLIDTGAYDIEECLDEVEEIAEFTGLNLVIEKGDIWHLEKLLTGPYDDDFCVIPKGEKVKVSDFGYSCLPDIQAANVVNIV